MSVRRGAVVVAAAIALVTAGCDASSDDPRPAVTTATTSTVSVAPTAGPAQAAIAVSTGLFDRSPVAVLTTQDQAAGAIATATRLKVPVLLDGPATPAELARLRATTVLTYGDTQDVVGGTPATSEVVARQKVGSPQRTDAVVLMKSTRTFAVAAATAKIAGADLLPSAIADPRRDPRATALLAERPKAAVIAVGAPFTESLPYQVAAIQSKATQLGGGYLALPGRAFVALHGALDDPKAGVLGRGSIDDAVKLIERAVPQHERAARAAGVKGPIVPTFEVLTDGTDAAALEPLLDAADDAGAYVLLDVGAGVDGDLLGPTTALKKLLTRPHVGLSVEPAKATAAQLDEVSGWLADLVEAENLPQKLFVLHRSSTTKLPALRDLDLSRPELAPVLLVDAVGDTPAKVAAYQAAAADLPRGASLGWTNDFTRDRPALSPQQTWQVPPSPKPSVVVYR